MQELFSPIVPPLRQVRPSKTTVATYMFGDASGSGFGNSLEIDHNLYYSHGQWNQDHSRESSNFRELANLVLAIQNAKEGGLLNNTELFVFTDNGTTESTFYKGTSSSRKLFELMLQLHKLEMHSGVILHLIHVSGKRMISQGTDALSRGAATLGVMAGSPMLSFVPLHLDAVHRGGQVLTDWLLS